MPDVTLAALVFGPLVITYFLKSNAALGFLALCVGFVSSTSVIGDLKHLLSETNLSVANDTIGLILLLLPLVLTLLLSKGFIAHRGPGFILQLAAALCTGGLLALSAGPLLSSSSQFDATSSSLWKNLTSAQAVIIGAGGLLSLLIVWSHNFRAHRRH